MGEQEASAQQGYEQQAPERRAAEAAEVGRGGCRRYCPCCPGASGVRMTVAAGLPVLE